MSDKKDIIWESLPTSCRLHEDRLKSLEDSIKAILDKDNDIKIKVINGTTTERLMSELVGEMYVAVKQLQKETPKNIFVALSKFSTALMPVLFVIALILMILGYEHLARQIVTLSK